MQDGVHLSPEVGAHAKEHAPCLRTLRLGRKRCPCLTPSATAEIACDARVLALEPYVVDLIAACDRYLSPAEDVAEIQFLAQEHVGNDDRSVEQD